jgi:hypothetical protein
LNEREWQIKQALIADAVGLYFKAVTKSEMKSVNLPKNTLSNIFKELGYPPWINPQHIYYSISKGKHQQSNKTSGVPHTFVGSSSGAMTRSQLQMLLKRGKKVSAEKGFRGEQKAVSSDM